MLDSTGHSGDSPAEALQRLWEQGQQPSLQEFLASVGELPLDQLAEVLHVDQQQRWLKGNPIYAESYFHDFPALRDDPDLAVDLIYHEFLLCEKSGDHPDAESFERRFPMYAKTLAQQIALHRSLKPQEPTWTRKQLTGAAPDGVPAAPRLPEQFGRYRIERLIGQGGMGAVYLAHDTQLDRVVALKVPHFDQRNDRELIERFYREARIAGTFHHPDLCPIYDVGRIDDIDYLTMPLLNGESLQALLQRSGRLPPLVAVRLAVRVARAIEFAHQAGVVHRDLKPSNIMVLPGEHPVVMDFGLARRERSADPTITSPGTVVGTVGYMPPEQMNSKAGLAGPAGDIYSLGAVLYQMLAGRAPFIGSLEDVLRDARTKPPPSLPALSPDVDSRLESICLRALAKDPNQRYGSAAELAAELEKWQCDHAKNKESATRVTVVTPTPASAHLSFARHRRLWIGGVTAAIVFAVLCGLVIVYKPFAHPIARPPADPLPASSRWEGAFKFRPPHQDITGAVVLNIQSREGDRFVAIYATENGQWQYEGIGQIHESEITLEFTRIIHEAEPRRIVGIAKVTGRVHGDRMELLYQDEDSVADMTLWRTN